jgi:hypothetical protein
MPETPGIKGTLLLGMFVTLVAWLDRRDQRKKNRGSNEAEQPSDKHRRVNRDQAPSYHRYPTEEEHRAHREKHWKLQFWADGAAVVLSAIALIVAVVGYLSLRDQTTAAWVAIKETRDAFRIDDRGWVEIISGSNSRLPPLPGFGNLFRYEFYLKNVGKTIAQKVTVVAMQTDSGIDFGKNETAIDGVQNKFLLGKFVDSETNMPVEIPSQWVPGSLAPNATSVAPFILVGSAPHQFDTGAWGYSFLVGRIDYFDAFGVPHWLRFCLFVANQEGNLRSCKVGNDEDDNPETESRDTPRRG